MLELKITAKVHSSAEKNIIGIKEEIVYAIENIADVLFVDVKTSEPLQLTLEDKLKIRPKVTVNIAVAELMKLNLTVEEAQNIIQALIKLFKIKQEDVTSDGIQ